MDNGSPKQQWPIWRCSAYRSSQEKTKHHSPESIWHCGLTLGAGWESLPLPEHVLNIWSRTDLLFLTIKGFRNYIQRSEQSFWIWNVPFSMAEDGSHDKFMDIESQTLGHREAGPPHLHHRMRFPHSKEHFWKVTRIKMQTRQVLSMCLVFCSSVTPTAPSPAHHGSRTPGAEHPEVELPVHGQQECLGWRIQLAKNEAMTYIGALPVS